jgi:hypothetical protein
LPWPTSSRRPAASRWNDDQLCLRPGLTREQLCGDDGSTARTMNALATVGFLGGVALAGASGVPVRQRAAAPRRRPRSCGPSLRRRPGAVRLEVTCGGVF